MSTLNERHTLAEHNRKSGKNQSQKNFNGIA